MEGVAKTQAVDMPVSVGSKPSVFNSVWMLWMRSSATGFNLVGGFDSSNVSEEEAS